MLRARSRTLAPLLLALTALTAAGCASASSGQLLLADAPDPQGAATDIAIYAVDPGEQPDDDTVLTRSALSPLDVRTTTAEGTTWVNSLGRVWDGSVLLAYGDGESNIVTSGEPGAKQTELARSTSARTTVIRRGAYVETAEGCELATSADSVDQVGEGNCSISLDERWVASWPADGNGLTIRDLRHDSTEELADLQVGNVGVLSADARALAVVRVAEGFQGVLIDATDGDEIARTDTFEYLDVATIGTDAEGFVLQTGSADGTQLLYMDTEGDVTTIDEGFYLVPVINGAEVTYLKYGEDLAESALRRWSPDEEPDSLLSGYVGAGSPDGEHVLATKETEAGTEFWREDGGTGEMTKVLTLQRGDEQGDPASGSGTGVNVSQMQTLGSMVHLQVDGAATTSYVRIDMVGDRSDAPVTDAENLLFESLDVDGTALLTQAAGSTEEPLDDILVVGPHDDSPERRATVGRTAANLIHEGTIYLTDTSDPSRVTVSSVRSTGKDDDVEELYADKQIAGATWPQWGGATQSVFITPRLLLEQAAQSQQGQQGATTAQP